MDFEDKLLTLSEDYGIEKVLELQDIDPKFVISLLVDEGLIDMEDFFGKETDYEMH